jgi:hypothetical protein
MLIHSIERTDEAGESMMVISAKVKVGHRFARRILRDYSTKLVSRCRVHLAACLISDQNRQTIALTITHICYYEFF